METAKFSPNHNLTLVSDVPEMYPPVAVAALCSRHGTKLNDLADGIFINSTMTERERVAGLQYYLERLSDCNAVANPKSSLRYFFERASTQIPLLNRNAEAAKLVGKITLRHFEPVCIDFFMGSNSTANFLVKPIHLIKAAKDPELSQEFLVRLYNNVDVSNQKSARAAMEAFKFQYPAVCEEKLMPGITFAKNKTNDFARIWADTRSLGPSRDLIDTKFDELADTLLDVVPVEAYQVVQSFLRETKNNRNAYLHPCDGKKIEAIFGSAPSVHISSMRKANLATPRL